jgi:hypothetical protein
MNDAIAGDNASHDERAPAASRMTPGLNSDLVSAAPDDLER